MAKLEIGDIAPDFTLDGTDGPFTLSEHRGERVVLLFYPADETAVCTAQMCSYRDQAEDFDRLDATVVAISPQDLASKEAFKARHGLTLPLLADPGGAVANAYGVYVKRLNVAKRSTFIIDEHGAVAHAHSNPMSLTFDSVDDLHAALESLPAGV